VRFVTVEAHEMRTAAQPRHLLVLVSRQPTSTPHPDPRGPGKRSIGIAPAPAPRYADGVDASSPCPRVLQWGSVA
jgi:hypothetical protein